MLDAVFGSDNRQVGGHDVAYFGVERASSFDDYFSSVVPFSHDALVVSIFGNDDGADVVIGHYL